ncbi:hypothetical protein CLOM_g6154 [Closterium sp. NIES-68]|nr:hypothetical protein CLOM_g6154 [Closterium sp. NIES-68]GJP60891.1 hypothetical protein CLOP_g18105 [Closterium sp. NIES-67]
MSPRGLTEMQSRLHGSIRTDGYYSVDVWIGSPPRKFSLMVDTGSALTIVPCASCSPCGAHMNPPYSPAASSSYLPVACRAAPCAGHRCDRQQRCAYSRRYAEQSTSDGFLSSDLISFSPPPLAPSAGGSSAASASEERSSARSFSPPSASSNFSFFSWWWWPFSPSPSAASASSSSSPPSPSAPAQASSISSSASASSSFSPTSAQVHSPIPAPVSPLPRVLFGCAEAETGALSRQTADGVLGLGRGAYSLLAQLVGARAVAAEVFSICYGGGGGAAETADRDPRGGAGKGARRLGGERGAMIMGPVGLRAPAVMQYTGFDRMRMGTPFYQVVVHQFLVAGDPLAVEDAPLLFASGYGVVVDSGTTFSYLPSPLFEAFKRSVVSRVARGVRMLTDTEPQYQGMCFRSTSWTALQASTLSSFFPSVEVVFGEGAVYRLDPENFLFQHRKRTGVFCIGVFPNPDQGTILGGLMFRNTMLTFDLVNDRLGFWKAPCDQLMTYIVTPGAPGSEPGLEPGSETGSDSVSGLGPAGGGGNPVRRGRDPRDPYGVPAEQARAGRGSAADSGPGVDETTRDVTIDSSSSSSSSRSSSSSSSSSSVVSKHKRAPDAVAAGSNSDDDLAMVWAVADAMPSYRPVDSSKCAGCASHVDMELRFPVLSSGQLDTLEGQLTDELIRELVLEPGQVVIQSVWGTSPSGAAAEIWLVPYAGTTFLPAVTVQRVETTIHQHEMRLSAAFGPYNLTSFNAPPPDFSSSAAPSQSKPQVRWLWFLVAIPLFLLCVAAAVWFRVGRKEGEGDVAGRKRFVMVGRRLQQEALENERSERSERLERHERIERFERHSKVIGMTSQEPRTSPKQVVLGFGLMSGSVH